MTKTDQDFDTALRTEEQELLRQIADEPGYFSQLGTVFGGATGWVNLILVGAQALLFIAGVVCAVHFYQATNAHSAVFWGIPGAVSLLMALMIKLALWPVVQANRVLRAIKHLELQMAGRD